MLRPSLNPPRLNDPFLWLLAVAFLVAALWRGYELAFTDTATDRERQELVRDGD